MRERAQCTEACDDGHEYKQALGEGESGTVLIESCISAHLNPLRVLMVLRHLWIVRKATWHRQQLKLAREQE